MHLVSFTLQMSIKVVFMKNCSICKINTYRKLKYVGVVFSFYLVFILTRVKHDNAKLKQEFLIGTF